MRRGDFQAFLTGVGPYVQLATQALGITLPQDLQGEVQTGARVVRRGGSNVARQVRQGSRRATRDTRHAGGEHSSDRRAAAASLAHHRANGVCVGERHPSKRPGLRTQGRNREELPLGRGSGTRGSAVAGARRRDRQGGLLPREQNASNLRPPTTTDQGSSEQHQPRRVRRTLGTALHDGGCGTRACACTRSIAPRSQGYGLHSRRNRLYRERVT